MNIGAPTTAHFVTLAAGGYLDRDDDLRRYLLLGKPGEYRVSALYHNNSPGAGGLDVVAWTGELTAQPLVLTLERHVAANE